MKFNIENEGARGIRAQLLSSAAIAVCLPYLREMTKRKTVAAYDKPLSMTRREHLLQTTAVNRYLFATQGNIVTVTRPQKLDLRNYIISPSMV